MLQKVSVNFYQTGRSQEWKELFNQATFFNYDPDSPVSINKWVLPNAVTDAVTGVVYPTFLDISLNVGEVNDSNYIVDTHNSTTANLQIIYTQYVNMPKEALK